MKRNNYDFQITDFEAFKRRVDTSKKGRIDLEDVKFFLALSNSQIASNFSSIDRESIRNGYGGRSVVDSISSPLKELVGTGVNIKINENYQYSKLPERNSLIKQTDYIYSTDRYKPTYNNEYNQTQVGTMRESLKTSPHSYERRYEEVGIRGLSSQITDIKENPIYKSSTDKIESIRKSYGLSGKKPGFLDEKNKTPLAVSSYLDGNYLRPSVTNRFENNLSKPLNLNYKYTPLAQPIQAGNYGAQVNDLRHSESISHFTHAKPATSISPIRSQISLDKNHAMSQPYIVPNLPPKYEHSQPYYRSVSKSPIQSRLSYTQNEHINGSKPLTSIRGSVQNNYAQNYPTQLSQKVGYNSSLEGYNKNFSLYTPTIQSNLPTYTSKIPQDPLQKSHVLNVPSQEARMSYNKDTIREDARENEIGSRVNGIISHEGIRRSTVLESFQNEMKGSPIAKDNYDIKISRPEIERKEEFKFFKSGAGESLATEGSQSSVSLYRFANSKYEQLWNSGSD